MGREAIAEGLREWADDLDAEGRHLHYTAIDQLRAAADALEAAHKRIEEQDAMLAKVREWAESGPRTVLPWRNTAYAMAQEAVRDILDQLSPEPGAEEPGG